MKKDTVYIDNDDEITSITDKVQTAKNPIVALVLPKRCTVLQSSVNMKILNRAANNAGKKVVLITSEAALMPVAGAAGLFVAKTLQSKPAVPPSPQYDDSAVDTVTEETDEAEELDATKSIGELAGATAVAAMAVSGKDEEAPIELGDDPEEPKPKKGKKNKNDGEKKNKKLAVPNFDSFRAKLFAVVGGLILLIGLWYVATSVLPRAKIVIKTENKAVSVNMSVTASAAAKSIDAENMVVPSITKSLDKTETKKFAATGEKDLGTKATGEVTLSIACSAVDGVPPTIPAGTGVSTGSLTFITQDSVSLTIPSFSGGVCKFSDKVDVTAQNAGDQYNISNGRSFTVAGFSAVTGSNAKAMGGGTSKVVKVVSQNDCENAKNELLNTKTDALKVELEKQLKAEGYTPINDSFSVTPGKATCNPPVDAEANESTATVTFKSTMTGANTAGLEQLIQTEVNKDLASGQSIFDTGVKTATLTVKDRKTNGDIVFTLLTDAQTGIKQDPEAIAKSIAGKKRGETSGILRGQPGVTDVQISYRPFWVFKTPKNIKHISITFENNGNK